MRYGDGTSRQSFYFFAAILAVNLTHVKAEELRDTFRRW
jgi:hypothetical protein